MLLLIICLPCYRRNISMTDETIRSPVVETVECVWCGRSASYRIFVEPIKKPDNV